MRKKDKFTQIYFNEADPMTEIDTYNADLKRRLRSFAAEYPDLCRIVEPNVCNTKRRVEVLQKLQERGIPTIVWLTPILPYINDTEENVRSILRACSETGVKGVIDFGMGLTLRDGDREYYYAALDRHFPGLKERYIREFGNAYELPNPNAKQLRAIFHRFCEEHGMLSTPEDCFRYLNELPEPYPQISLF